MESRASVKLRRIERFLSLAASITTSICMAVIVIYIVTRLLRLTFPGVIELTQLLMALIVFFGLGYTQARGMNIRIDFLLQRLPSKIQFWLNLFALAVGLTIFALILWQTGEEAWGAIVKREFTMGVVKFPAWPSRCFVPFGCFILCLEILAEGVELISARKRT